MYNVPLTMKQSDNSAAFWASVAAQKRMDKNAADKMRSHISIFRRDGSSQSFSNNTNPSGGGGPVAGASSSSVSGNIGGIIGG